MQLSEMKGIGPVRQEALRAMGICSLRDLLYTLPVRYEDQMTLFPIDTREEGSVLVAGTVPEKPKISFFHGLSRVTASIRDESGKMPLCWYNEPWIMQQLPVGQPILLYGHLTIKNNRRVLQNPKLVTERGYIPVYRAVKGIPAKSFRELIRAALEEVDDCCPETLPKGFRIDNRLCELNFAIRQAHFPDNIENLRIARRRLAFENILLYLVYVSMSSSRKKPGYPVKCSEEIETRYWSSMPFPPTAAQKRVLSEIRNDLNQNEAMARLVQGDVGCGKTAVAFGAISLVCGGGYQAAMMAPTEILAVQHYQNALKTLAPLGIRCRILTGSTKAKDRRVILQELKDHECDAVFGTHALISRDVEYKKLGLVITDEQHRFGVNQRSLLQEKGQNEESRSPHVLVMSATPIPRTLALILYGDLELSVIDELPSGRIPVRTRIVPEEKREGMYEFLRNSLRSGRQAYIVCPTVEDSENGDSIQSAKSMFKHLCENELKGFRVALTWGNQKAPEKNAVLDGFSAGNYDVLVSTTVIEVGVNVPNATVMIVENAERFGLSQLHQLRGRVGRGSEESWCFLLSDANEKLKTLCATNDGFEIAQKDLALRGPGDLTGTRQSGEPLQGLPVDGDIRLLDEVSECVRRMHRDPACKETLSALEAQAEVYFAGQEHRIALN